MQPAKAERITVVISGYYNPVHAGHCEYARLAKEFAGPHGRVVCIVNNDKQVLLKKGHMGVPEGDRMAVMGSLRYVDDAVLSVDTDRTVCRTLQMLCDKGYRPTHFANGGDVTAGTSCPEKKVCEANDIVMVFGLGDKIQSSSSILQALRRSS
jgi:cytidyltransferase-like protein